MIVLDTTIVNVAMPSIDEDLRFSEISRVWVVNAYMLNSGDCLLPGGRPDDLFWWHIFPGMALAGIGSDISLSPVLLAAISDVDQRDAGLASGIVNTSFMMGDALGLAVLASIAATNTKHATLSGSINTEALTQGYPFAFGVGAMFAISAAGIGYWFILMHLHTEKI